MLNSILNNNKRIRKTCQEEIFNSFNPQPITEITDDPESFFSHARPAHIVILNEFLYGSSFFVNDYRSQATIALKTGYTRETVNRIIGDLIRWGLVISNYYHMDTCVYKVSSWFKNGFVRKKLSKIFTNIILLPLSLLISSGAVSQQNVTQSNLSNIYINSLYTVTTKIGETIMSVSNKNQKRSNNEVKWVSATTNTHTLFPELSDNAYLATNALSKKQSFTKRNISSIQSNAKSPQREMQKFPSVKETFVPSRYQMNELVLVKKAESLLQEYKSGRRRAFYIKSTLSHMTETIPSGRPALEQWFETDTGKEFLEITKDITIRTEHVPSSTTH